ncbi:MAG: hypothetical protein LBF56_03685 [Holosporales bacterium]|jgi:hypothetical protein|nr:hypothetical protein [Holosporales bacterium]
MNKIKYPSSVLAYSCAAIGCYACSNSTVLSSSNLPIIVTPKATIPQQVDQNTSSIADQPMADINDFGIKLGDDPDFGDDADPVITNGDNVGSGTVSDNETKATTISDDITSSQILHPHSGVPLTPSSHEIDSDSDANSGDDTSSVSISDSLDSLSTVADAMVQQFEHDLKEIVRKFLSGQSNSTSFSEDDSISSSSEEDTDTPASGEDSG